MPDLSITSYFTTAVEPTPSTLRIAAAFGLGLDREHKFYVLDDLKVSINPAQIVFITGQSGSGKSTLLKILKNVISPHIDLDYTTFDESKILPDNFDLPLERALYYLSLTGLADAFIFLRKPHELSDGQLYRFKLALALARCWENDTNVVFADQFLDNLDRVSARIIAHNTRKFATRFNTAFVLAAANDDITDTLKPDLLIEKHFGSEAIITTRHHKNFEP